MGGVQTKRAVALFLLAARIVAVGAGCGGGSKTSGNGANLNAALSPYEKAMLRLGGGLNATLTQVGLANRTAKGPAPIERNLRKSQVELRAAAVKLEKIVAPARIKARQARLIRGVREYADELNGVIANLKKGVGPRALAAISNLKGLRDMALATAAITKAGYVITISSS
jgi:hypothetical protein